MKKTIMTIAILLGLSMATFANPNGGGLFDRGAVPDEDYYGMSFRSDKPMLPFHEQNTNQPAAETPLGSGLAVLLCLGATYAIRKRNKD